jgi:diacylglycerol kinase (ATP)
MQQVRFIINPRSGQQDFERVERWIHDLVDTTRFDIDICRTQFGGHATELAREAAQAGYDMVVAVGGDGSVSEVMAGLVGTKTVLGIVPAGSGNGFSMYLGWGRNAQKALRLLGKKTSILQIDTGLMNGKPFINLAGIGLEAVVAQRLRSMTKRGFQAYFKATVSTIFTYKYKKYHITIDDKTIAREALSVTIANAPMYGYNFVIAPLAKLNDGELEVMIIKKAPIWKYLISLPKMLTQSFHKAIVVERLHGKKITIECIEDDYGQFDGEGFPLTTQRVEFGIRPNSLLVLVPDFSPALKL